MTSQDTGRGVLVYDPRGVVEAEATPLAERVAGLDGLRLAVLDNSQWNAGTLLRRVSGQLSDEIRFATVNHYCKESFSKNAAPALIDEIVADNDVVLTAIGD